MLFAAYALLFNYRNAINADRIMGVPVGDLKNILKVHFY